jgi:hypothetical protein
MEEVFQGITGKTRIMRRGVRQYRAGLVVNRTQTSFALDFDRLKATLTNCVRLGPDRQNPEGIRDFAFTLRDEWGLWKSSIRGEESVSAPCLKESGGGDGAKVLAC